jgi:hypothetical protein
MSRFLVTIVAISLLGCASVPDTAGQQRFTGWMMYRGELMLFSTRADYLIGSDSQRRSECNSDGECRSRILCISGVFEGQVPLNLRARDGERVTVTGRLLSYRELPAEDTPVLPRKLLAGKVVSNFCLRDEVILISSLAPA